MIQAKLKAIVEQAIAKAIDAGELKHLSACPVPIVIEAPRLPEHGDLSCGVALRLACHAKTSPIKIAETIAQFLEVNSENVSRFEVASPGFINFHLGTGWLAEALCEVIKLGSAFGKLDLGAGQKALIEYVSANPTGDLHIGHGRGAVYGSCLANLLHFVGFAVEQEFYLNDTGEQINQLGRCAWAAYKRLLGQDVVYPSEGYPEDSLKDFVNQVIKEHGDKFLSLNDTAGEETLRDVTMASIILSHKNLLDRLGVKFNRWFSELSLHQKDQVEAVLSEFSKRGQSYESDGAVWLKAKELGDERDRVLKKSGGTTTYLAADAAYHLDKYERGYDRLITIWGSDHHGQVPGLKAAVKALGKDPNKLEVILTQIVNLSRNGQIVRMSKRMGTVVTLAEVMDEVGTDAVRYYLAESNPQNPINFDLALAKQTSRENPAFYIQYAHARCSSILRKALEPSNNPDTHELTPAPVSRSQWDKWLSEYKSSPEVFSAIFDPQIFAHQKRLVMRLVSFPGEIEDAAITRSPGRLARYAYELANDLQKFYEVCRVITPNEEVTRARLGLILATRQVLQNVLGIIGISAPEKM
ncbi:MAG: arginine--tRNA ligase [Candidatus Melainabacteria bacterium]|nr:arginine--tRNA ligase [Candidatus Melainabacteria bacterium]